MKTLLILFCSIFVSCVKVERWPNFDTGVIISKKQLTESEIKTLIITIPIIEQKTTNCCIYKDNSGGVFIAPIKAFDIGDSLNKYFEK